MRPELKQQTELKMAKPAPKVIKAGPKLVKVASKVVFTSFAQPKVVKVETKVAKVEAKAVKPEQKKKDVKIGSEEKTVKGKVGTLFNYTMHLVNNIAFNSMRSPISHTFFLNQLPTLHLKI